MAVAEVNVAPVLVPVGPQSVGELERLAFTATASDVDVIGGADDSLVFSLTGTVPTGATINPDSGSFSWTPAANQAGQHTITIQVEDGAGLRDSGVVTVTVGGSNVNPVLEPIGSKSGNELERLAFTVTASDADADDSLTFTLAGTPPSGASITNNGAFSWTPTEAQDGSHTITVRVEDGNGGSDSEAVTVTVNEVNAAPVLASIGSKSVDELETLAFPVTATDADVIGGDDDTLVFSLTGTVPTGATINPDSGSFSWTPDQSQDGTHYITVQVADGRGGTDSQEVTVTVNDIAPLPASARSAGSSITLTLSEAVTSSGTGPNGFSVEAGADPVSVDSITGSGTKSLVLGLSGPISAPATLSYSGGDVTDENGNALGSFDLPVSFQSKKSRSTAAAPPAITADSQGHSSSAAPEWAGQPAPEGPLPPVPAGGAQYPLTVDQNGYALRSSTSTVMPTNVTAGQTVTMSVTVHDATPIAYFAIYLHLQGDEASHLDSDAQIIWNNGQTHIIDRSGLMQDAVITLSEDPDDPAIKTFTITVILSEGMGQTNLVIRTWNAAGQLAEVRVFDAVAVTAPGVDPEPGVTDPEPGVTDPEPTGMIDVVDPEPESSTDQDPAGRDLLAIRMWSGFEPESITDAQLLAVLGLDYPGADIPSWVMTELGVLVSNGEVTVEQFRTALEYVLGAL